MILEYNNHVFFVASIQWCQVHHEQPNLSPSFPFFLSPSITLCLFSPPLSLSPSIPLSQFFVLGSSLTAYSCV